MYSLKCWVLDMRHCQIQSNFWGIDDLCKLGKGYSIALTCNLCTSFYTVFQKTCDHIFRRTDRRTDRQSVRRTDRQTDRRTDRQTDIQTNIILFCLLIIQLKVYNGTI